jgi:hypothetical protein
MTTPSPPARLRGQHPLDFLPLFQRWPQTPLRAIIMTAVLGMTMGGTISLIQVMLFGGGRLRDIVLPMLVIGNLVGFLIHGGLVGLALLLRGWPLRQTGMVRSVYYTSVVAVLAVLGVALGNAILQGRNPLHYVDDYAELAPIVPFALVMSLLMLVLTTVGARRAQAEVQMLRQREEMAATAQLLTEAKLRALQAQIEPHFLYNTLANVLATCSSGSSISCVPACTPAAPTPPPWAPSSTWRPRISTCWPCGWESACSTASRLTMPPAP